MGELLDRINRLPANERQQKLVRRAQRGRARLVFNDESEEFPGVDQPFRERTPDLDGEFLWPFYERVEALGVPLLVHGVDSGPLLGVGRFARFNLDVCLGFPFEVFMAISALIFSGVLDRFPGLRFGFFEVGVGWIPWFIDRQEMAYDARAAAREKATRWPKECF